MKPLRFFYIPNEASAGDQVGPHKAFRLLQEQGVFSALRSYSYLVERHRFQRHEDALADLLRAADAFQPDVIFWQHLNSTYAVDRAFLQCLKAMASKPKLVWHDPDPYGRIIKRIDPVMKNAISECDMAILVGLGYLAEHARTAGAKRILFAPHSYDDVRFAQPWQPTLQRRYDAIMIANLTCLKRIPFLYMPGGRKRKILSRAFYRAYGPRYAVFGGGQGWQGEPYCQGPIKFNDQEVTIRNAWLTLNWGPVRSDTDVFVRPAADQPGQRCCAHHQPPARLRASLPRRQGHLFRAQPGRGAGRGRHAAQPAARAVD